MVVAMNNSAQIRQRMCIEHKIRKVLNYACSNTLLCISFINRCNAFIYLSKKFVMKTLRLFLISVFAFGLTNFAFAQDDGKTEALTALGSASGLLMYNTYVGIGAIADGYSGDVYDSTTVASLMTEQI